MLLADGMPTDVVEVVRAYLAGELGTKELATRLEGIRMKTLREAGGSSEL